MSFLYEANHPKEKLGKTMCSFALETVYMKLVGDEGAAGGSAGTNIGTRAIYDTTNATETMQFVKDVSRGKSRQYKKPAYLDKNIMNYIIYSYIYI